MLWKSWPGDKSLDAKWASDVTAGTQNNGINLLFIWQFWTHGKEEKKNKYQNNDFIEFGWEILVSTTENRSVSCMFCRYTGVRIWRSKMQLSCKKLLIYTVRGFQNIRYFDTELMWRINMEISKHSWSSWSLYGINRKSCNRSTNGLVANCRQQADIRMRLRDLFRFVVTNLQEVICRLVASGRDISGNTVAYKIITTCLQQIGATLW